MKEGDREAETEKEREQDTFYIVLHCYMVHFV